MGETTSLQAADGHRLDAYVARPQGAPRGGLVVVQEIFGVNAHIRAVADGFAADGYLAVAPAMFDRVERGVEMGYGPEDIARGRALRSRIPDDAVLADVQAAVAHAAAAGRVGIVGYCWGGTVSWLAACRLDGLAAAVAYYGAGVPGLAGEQARCPVMAHFGERDASIPLDAVQAFAKAQPAVQVHLYPADHGFNCDHRAAYDAPSARLARERTLAFLRQHLG